MFLVINKNKKTGSISVLDTDDMKVDIFEQNELQSLVKQYKLKISGYPTSSNGIFVKNTYISRDSVVWYSPVTRSSLNYIIYMKGLKAFGDLDWTSFISNAESFTSPRALELVLDTSSLSGLQKLLSLYMTILRFVGEKTFLIEMLYDVYTGAIHKTVKGSVMHGELWGSSCEDLLKSINFIEYSNEIFFFDDTIVLGVKKSMFDSIKTANAYNAKAVTLGSKVRMDCITNKVKLSSCDSLVMRSGYTYELVSHVEISKLEIKKGADFSCRSKLYKLEIPCLKCEDLECFEKLIKYADFYNLSIPLSHLIVLINQYQYWDSCDFTITDIDCPVEDLVNVIHNSVKNVISDTLYRKLSSLEGMLNVDLLSRYPIHMLRADFLSLFYNIFGADLYDCIVEMCESDDVVEHMQTRIMLFMIKRFKNSGLISVNSYNVHMEKLCYDNEVRNLKSDKCRSEINGAICNAIKYLYNLSKKYGFKYSSQKNRSEIVQRLCISSLSCISQNLGGSCIWDIPLHSSYISLIESAIKSFEELNKFINGMSISIRVNIKDKRIIGLSEPNFGKIENLCKEAGLFSEFNFKWG